MFVQPNVVSSPSNSKPVNSFVAASQYYRPAYHPTPTPSHRPVVPSRPTYQPTTSIVDWLKSKGRSGSWADEQALARQYGIQGYQGTAAQNIALLNKVRSGSLPPSAPSGSAVQPRATHHINTTKPPVAPSRISSADQQFYKEYTQAEQNGTADLSQLQRYNEITKKWGLKGGQISNDALHKLSLSALGGDTNAQNYLKSMGIKSQSGSALWNGVTDAQLNANHDLRSAYWQQNPYADYTKQHDMSDYNRYVNMINNNEGMSPWQRYVYQNDINKWGLQDVTDPYYKQQQQLKSDETQALNAQDVALNQGLATQDANNFQAMQKTKQDVANRGMAPDSGIAQDAYMRATMAANQNYQQAYADAANQKANITSQYDKAISDSQIAQNTNKEQQAQNAIKNQSAQDQFLTAQTGYVFQNGQPLKDSKGNPITTLNYQKMTETQRHDLATENNTAIKNAESYSLGMTNASNNAQKIANDYNLGNAKLTAQVQQWANVDANAAKLTNLKGAQLQEQINKDQETASEARAKISNAQDKQIYDAYVAQMKTAGSEIQKIQGSKTPDPTALAYWKGQYSLAANAMAGILGKDNSSGGVGGAANNTSGGGIALSSTPKSYQRDMAEAVRMENIPSSQIPYMDWVIQHESSYNPNAKNPSSTAIGYGQFLNTTRNEYNQKTGLNYMASGADQIAETYRYMVDRYGSPQKAMEFWQKHNWY